jgi:hypothetical protein
MQEALTRVPWGAECTAGEAVFHGPSGETAVIHRGWRHVRRQWPFLRLGWEGGSLVTDHDVV